MCDRDNEISLNKQVKFQDLKIMLVKIMKYAEKENLSRGHGEDRESWTRGMTC